MAYSYDRRSQTSKRGMAPNDLEQFLDFADVVRGQMQTAKTAIKAKGGHGLREAKNRVKEAQQYLKKAAQALDRAEKSYSR